MTLHAARPLRPLQPSTIHTMHVAPCINRVWSKSHGSQPVCTADASQAPFQLLVVLCTEFPAAQAAFLRSGRKGICLRSLEYARLLLVDSMQAELLRNLKAMRMWFEYVRHAGASSRMCN